MARGDTIFVISPGYLDAVSTCISKYKDFELQAYSSSLRAVDGLERTPSYSYLGFCYLNSMIEDDDFNNLRMIVNKVNIMFQDLVNPEDDKTRVPFLFILSSKEGGNKGTSNYVRHMLQGIDLSNILLMYYDFSIMTDTVIKAQMFGTILLRNRDFEIRVPEKEYSENRVTSMAIELPFESKFIELFSELTFIEVDSFIKKYSRTEPLLTSIRRYMYTKDTGLMSDINHSIESLDLKDRIFYECCLRNLFLVEEGGKL